MSEKFLLRISIVCSLAGLVLLFFISQTLELPPTAINLLTIDDIGKNIKICGEITSRFVSKTNHVFLQLKDDTGKIDVIIFNNTAEKLNAYELNQSKICVIGSVDEYENKLEIIVKKIEV
ncbi:MAG: OB-fold nucleic acid binding domain-containing protein [Candidatus Aenigmarchaeota archaeon]|nr:OB-fold nucleic acid binding domain-containing protein [Candidatus Aenigmarchaeota archaeon]